jgi:ribose 5-phosphate isomerase B
VEESGELAVKNAVDAMAGPAIALERRHNVRIAIGSDHAGFRLKQEIAGDLKGRGLSIDDLGTYDETSVDYPDFARAVAEAVARGEYDRGLLVCGTGIGVSITANKVRGVRAAVCSDTFSARMSREHNDANVLCVGARVVGVGLALDIVKTWLEASFEGGRHQGRVEKIMLVERTQQTV